MKCLDRKLANILRDASGAEDFIIAAAEDADLTFGVTAPGAPRRAPE